MSLNHLMSPTFDIKLSTKTFKTDALSLKMDNGDYIEFKLPDKGLNKQVLSSTGNGLKWIQNETNITQIYIKNATENLNFINNLRIDNEFTLHRIGNFNDRVITHKVLLHINLIYQWVNASYAPDFALKILVSGVNVYTNTEGLSDYPSVSNKLSENIILDMNESDTIQIHLAKISSNDVSVFKLHKNSYFSIELL